MSINKFKPGDKVMVKFGLEFDVDYDDVFCNEEMCCMAGSVLTIKEVDPLCYGSGAYLVHECEWVFNDEMLNPYNILLEQEICCFREASEFETRYEPTDISSVVNLYGGN